MLIVVVLPDPFEPINADFSFVYFQIQPIHRFDGSFLVDFDKVRGLDDGLRAHHYDSKLSFLMGSSLSEYL
jgi:hypothetical protein